MINLWDQKAKWYHVARQIPIVRHLYQTELRLLRSLIPDRTFSCHLDIGTGTGSSLSVFRRASVMILSDRSLRMLQIAFQHHSVPAVVLDLEQGLPFKNQSFDFLTAVGVFEYLRDPTAALCELHRVAKHRAFLLFTTTPFSLFALFRYLTGNPPHIYHEKDIVHRIEAAGWSKIDQRKCRTQEQWLCQKQE